MAGPLWRASIENTSVPGGAFALQVKPPLVRTAVTFYPGSDPRTSGRPRTVDWHTGIVAVREVEVNPSGSSPGGFVSRPVVGRVVPPWEPTRNAELIQLGFTGYRAGARVRKGQTPRGTIAGGPSFSEQISLPRTGGPTHKQFHMRMHYPDEAPLIVYGAGSHDYETDGATLPTPAVVLYCGSTTTTSTQTLHGSITFEEL